MQKLRVYLDHCCYNRPYDDQSQLRISLETQAKLAIQQMIRDGEIELVTSYWNEFELAANPIEIRRKNIQEFQNEYATAYVSDEGDSKVQQISSDLQNNGIKYKDACHVACALLSNCDYFVSTDERLLKHTHKGIALINPVEFIGIVEGNRQKDNYDSFDENAVNTEERKSEAESNANSYEHIEIEEEEEK